MRHCVRIRYLEAALLQIIGKIQFRPAHEKSALRIDNYADPVRFNKNVTIRRTIHQIHLVLKPRATSTDHRDPQGPVGPTLSRKEGAQLRARSIQHANQLLVADLVVDRRGLHRPQNTGFQRGRKLAQGLLRNLPAARKPHFLVVIEIKSQYKEIVRKGSEFSEEPIWAEIEGEWRPLFGSFPKMGVSVEWHDFECPSTLEWSRSFHPESLEICINFEGCGAIHERPAQTTIVNPQRVAHYAADESRLRADRHAGQRHRFLPLEMSRAWLSEAVRGHEAVLDRETRGFLGGEARLRTAREQPLNPRVRRSAEEMLRPPGAGTRRRPLVPREDS